MYTYVKGKGWVLFVNSPKILARNDIVALIRVKDCPPDVMRSSGDTYDLKHHDANDVLEIFRYHSDKTTFYRKGNILDGDFEPAHESWVCVISIDDIGAL